MTNMKVLLAFVLVGLSSAVPPPGYVKRPDHDKRPPKYDFGYNVNDGHGGRQGHLESREGVFGRGMYYVTTPNSGQRVEYFTDDWGYHPYVKYGSSTAGGSSSAEFAVGEQAVNELNRAKGAEASSAAASSAAHPGQTQGHATSSSSTSNLHQGQGQRLSATFLVDANVPQVDVVSGNDLESTEYLVKGSDSVGQQVSADHSAVQAPSTTTIFGASALPLQQSHPEYQLAESTAHSSESSYSAPRYGTKLSASLPRRHREKFNYIQTEDSVKPSPSTHSTLRPIVVADYEQHVTSSPHHVTSTTESPLYAHSDVSSASYESTTSNSLSTPGSYLTSTPAPAFYSSGSYASEHAGFESTNYGDSGHINVEATPQPHQLSSVTYGNSPPAAPVGYLASPSPLPSPTPPTILITPKPQPLVELLTSGQEGLSLVPVNQNLAGHSHDEHLESPDLTHHSIANKFFKDKFKSSTIVEVQKAVPIEFEEQILSHEEEQQIKHNGIPIDYIQQIVDTAEHASHQQHHDAVEAAEQYGHNGNSQGQEIGGQTVDYKTQLRGVGHRLHLDALKQENQAQDDRRFQEASQQYHKEILKSFNEHQQQQEQQHQQQQAHEQQNPEYHQQVVNVELSPYDQQLLNNQEEIDKLRQTHETIREHQQADEVIDLRPAITGSHDTRQADEQLYEQSKQITQQLIQAQIENDNLRQNHEAAKAHRINEEIIDLRPPILHQHLLHAKEANKKLRQQYSQLRNHKHYHKIEDFRPPSHYDRPVYIPRQVHHHVHQQPHVHVHQQPHVELHHEVHHQPTVQVHQQIHQQPSIQLHQQPHVEFHQEVHHQPTVQVHQQIHQQPAVQLHQQPHVELHHEVHHQPTVQVHQQIHQQPAIQLHQEIHQQPSEQQHQQPELQLTLNPEFLKANQQLLKGQAAYQQLRINQEALEAATQLHSIPAEQQQPEIQIVQDNGQQYNQQLFQVELNQQQQQQLLLPQQQQELQLSQQPQQQQLSQQQQQLLLQQQAPNQQLIKDQNSALSQQYNQQLLANVIRKPSSSALIQQSINTNHQSKLKFNLQQDVEKQAEVEKDYSQQLVEENKQDTLQTDKQQGDHLRQILEAEKQGPLEYNQELVQLNVDSYPSSQPNFQFSPAPPVQVQQFPVEHTKVVQVETPVIVQHQVPVEHVKYVEKPIHVEHTKVVEVNKPYPVPYPVRVDHTRVVDRPVPVPHIVPVEVTKLVPVDRPWPYPQPYPVAHPVAVPYAVPHPYPVPVNHYIHYPHVVHVPIKSHPTPSAATLANNPHFQAAAAHAYLKTAVGGSGAGANRAQFNYYKTNNHYGPTPLKSGRGLNHQQLVWHQQKAKSLNIEYGFKPPLIPSLQIPVDPEPEEIKSYKI